MRLVSQTLLKIEADVVEEFARHTARYVDELFFYDQAVDGARAILEQLKNEGLPITIFDPPESKIVPPNHSARVRDAFERTGADFVLPLDADEFLKAGSRGDLEASLAALAPGAHASIAWTSYVPGPADDVTEERILARITHRRRVESVQYYKTIISRSFLEVPEHNIGIGAHHIEGAESTTSLLADVTLGHFPVRGLEQIRGKAALGWCTILALGAEEQKDLAYQWRDIFARLKQTPHAWSAEDLHRIGLEYLGSGDAELVRDPIEPVERRYHGFTPHVLDVMVEHVRLISHEYRALRTAAGLTISL